MGSTEIYLRSLLGALGRIDEKKQYFVFVNRESVNDPPIEMTRFHLIPCPVNARNRPRRILWEQTIFPLLLRKYKIDVLFNPGYTMPLLFRGPSVTVFHDLQHRRHPEFFRWFDLPFWRLLLWASARRSRSLIAVSEATARDLERYFPGVSGKTVVVEHGVDPECFRVAERRAEKRDSQSGQKYLLTVSTLHPHKNIGRLLEAFHLFRSTHPEYRMVIAGIKGFASAELESRRRDLKLEQSVTFTGWIPRAALYELFENADAYVAPSRFEGFGMPILEALAAGIPAACSRIAPIDQIAGSAAFQFDPDSVAEIAAAMEFVTMDADFRARAPIAGSQRSRQFDWDKAAALTLHEIESVVLHP